MVSEWEAGRLGRSRSGFQWGEEKPASFPTTQHSRSDHCGSFPTCCAVQETGTRHTTFNSQRSPNRLQISLPLPLAIHNPPSPTNPHRHHLHRQQKLQDFHSVFFFFHTKTFLLISISDRQQNSGAQRSQVGGGGLLPPGKLAYLKPTRQPSPHHTHTNTHTLELLRLF